MKATVMAALPLMILIASAVGGADKQVTADLLTKGSTGVTGTVQVIQMPKGGSNLNVRARGLHPGAEYTSQYYKSSDCSEPAVTLGTFTADPNGEGGIEGRIEVDLDEVGSVSVRRGHELQACARMH